MRTEIKMSPILLILAASLMFSISAAIAEDKPNQGRAEAVGEFVGGVAGAAAAGAGAVASGAGGGAAGAAGVIGEKAGSAAGAAAGAALDKNAADNAKSGRGGSDDPRYSPSSLFNQ